MDKCEEMRAQFDRFCDGQLADSGTTQIQAISSSQMKNIRKYFVPGIYSFDIVGFLDTTLLKTGKEGYLFTVDGVYYKEFLEKPGHFHYNDVAKTEIILPKPKDNESTLEIRFQNGRWCVWLVTCCTRPARSSCWTACARSRRDTPMRTMRTRRRHHIPFYGKRHIRSGAARRIW